MIESTVHTSYDLALVATSVVIASLASYTALDLAGRVSVAQGRGRLAWLASGSTAMGLGIWSMHFIGMLAFQMPMHIAYDVPLVVLSALIAIAASGLAMVVVSRVQLPVQRLATAGVIMGTAIGGMHYTGMAAMRMPAAISYDPFRFWLSIAIAITASMVALWIAFQLRYDDTLLGRWRRGGAAVIMGFAIAGMHYTGMSAARFVSQDSAPTSFPHSIPAGTPLAIAVIGGALLVLILALVGTTVDRRTRLAEAEHARLRQMRDEMEEQVVRRTAELRAALAAAEQANRAKSDFLARMSHELRTPLNSVIGFAHVLEKNKAGNMRPQDLSYVERIAANGRHLLSLINGILDLAKIEAGRMETEITQVALGPLVDDVVTQLTGVLRDRPVQLLTEVPRKVRPIATDEAKLRQVLVNLIANAIKFTETGSITVRVITNADATPHRIDVIDTGIGIPADRLDAVFQPFEQADNSTTRKYGGTGLGLAITRSLCGLLGANLTVSSAVGSGSTFSVVFSAVARDTGAPPPRPSAPRKVVAHPAPVAQPVGLEDRLVLIIDDDPDARTVLSQYVQDAGCRVLTAASGTEGLRLAAAHRPDIITLDLMMPEMSGWSVLRHLKSDPALERIPVVVVSIVAGDSRGSVFGAVDLLDKPCTRDDLVAALRRNVRPTPTRVLLVEDDPDARAVMLHHLQDQGHIDARTADSGITALQTLATFVPHLILLDVMMPTMDGVTFLTHIRKDPRYARIPVVVVTAKELSAEEHDRLAAQTLEIVQKGDDVEAALHRALEQVAGGRPSGDAPRVEAPSADAARAGQTVPEKSHRR